MLNDSTDMFIALVLGSGCLVMIVVYLDWHFTHRRNLAANAGFRRRLHEGRKNSPLHLVGSEHHSRRRYPDLVVGPETLVRKPGFFSKQRVVSDRSGRVIATHYEELVINDLSAGSRLLLSGGNNLKAA
jgi:hypothetical protein